MTKITNDYYVYMHIFPNNKKYVGVSHQEPNRRFRNGKGYKDQFVYNEILKYGWNNIKHIILENKLTWKEAQDKEKYYILKYDTQNNGYNISLGQQPTDKVKKTYFKSKGMTGKHHTFETKEKIRKANIGKIMSLQTKINKSKSIIQFDKTNNFINEYYGLTEASKKTNIPISNISKCAMGKRKSAGGYIWKFKEELINATN